MNANRDALWEILEKYSETRLFRDWNDTTVNALLRAFASEVEDWSRKADWTPQPVSENSDIDDIVLRGDLLLDPEPYVFQSSRFAERDKWGDRRFAPRKEYEQDGKRYK